MAMVDVAEALAQCAAGQFLIIIDEENPSSQGDFMVSAGAVSAEALNVMLREARGMMYVAMAPERLEELAIPLMVGDEPIGPRAAACVSVDARACADTGGSTEGRAATIRLLADPEATGGDFVRPGHVYPLRAQRGGVLRRVGHTEAATDITRLAGLEPVAVICQIMREDGTLAQLPQLEQFADAHGTCIVSIKALIQYRSRTEKLIKREESACLPTAFGDFEVVGYSSLVDGTEYIALVKGDVAGAEDVLVRVHSECLTGDAFHSLRCDCGLQLSRAMEMIEEAGRGVIVYIQGHEGRGIGICNKVKAYRLQDEGLDTVEANERLGFPADMRDYGIGAQVLADLGITTMRIMTNNPKKLVGLEGYGLRVTGREPILCKPTRHNIRYLEAKCEKLGHMLGLGASADSE
ncbi:MAG: GTP cyclohydrolase II [Armatimonadota bacterium]|jgi:3,4-dihydroxy 2-butanone 4-phosphate synthase/GTP cyclohydrolase II